MSMPEITYDAAGMDAFKQRRLAAMLRWAGRGAGAGLLLGSIPVLGKALTGGSEPEIAPFEDNTLQVGDLRLRNKKRYPWQRPEAEEMPGVQPKIAAAPEIAPMPPPLTPPTDPGMMDQLKGLGSQAFNAASQLVPGENVVNPGSGIYGPALAIGSASIPGALAYKLMQRLGKNVTQHSRQGEVDEAKSRYERALRDQYKFASEKVHSKPTETYGDLLSTAEPMDTAYAQFQKQAQDPLPSAAAPAAAPVTAPTPAPANSSSGNFIDKFPVGGEIFKQLHGRLLGGATGTSPGEASDTMLGAILAGSLVSGIGSGALAYNWAGKKTREELKNEILSRRTFARRQNHYDPTPLLYATAN